jgi:hypothetical protein
MASNQSGGSKQPGDSERGGSDSIPAAVHRSGEGGLRRASTGFSACLLRRGHLCRGQFLAPSVVWAAHIECDVEKLPAFV